MMRSRLPKTAARPYTAAACAGILTLGLVTAPPPAPTVPVPRVEVQAVQLFSVTTADLTPAPTPPATNQTANDTAPPDFLAFAAEILTYLNSLGLGAGPGLAAIGLSGLVVAFAATAYAWNGFADTVNPGLRFLRIPRVPKFPVCFAGQQCASSAASVRARVAKPASGLVTPTGRGVASSKRVAAGKSTTTAAKVRSTAKSSPAAAGKGRSAR
ncbi:hypothetical protein MycrhDRAFT_4405 [Mycolicibacterium rhodesiae JS60]|nr:hypothetical protein MycrhDRAFT_4405 [Mycolicibacterium rhodesiae JS60]